MSSIHRGGLMVSAIVAALTVLGALTLDSYVSAMNAAVPATASPQALTATPTEVTTATPTLEPETIYVMPVPTPAVVTITRAAPPVIVRPGPAATPPVIHIIVPSPTGGDDGGGDDGGVDH